MFMFCFIQYIVCLDCACLRWLQVAVYVPLSGETPIGCSDAMFVHNNSKHGRKANPVYPGREAIIGDGELEEF